MGEIRIEGLEYVYRDFSQSSTMEEASYSVDSNDFSEFPEGSSAEGRITYPQIKLPKPLSKSQIYFRRKGKNYGFSIVVSGNFAEYNKRCSELLQEHLSKSDLEIIAMQNVIHLARQSVDEKIEPDYTIVNREDRREKNQLFVINSGMKGARIRRLEGYKFFLNNIEEAMSIANGIVSPILSNKKIQAHSLTFTLSPI